MSVRNPIQDIATFLGSRLPPMQPSWCGRTLPSPEIEAGSTLDPYSVLRDLPPFLKMLLA